MVVFLAKQGGAKDLTAITSFVTLGSGGRSIRIIVVTATIGGIFGRRRMAEKDTGYRLDEQISPAIRKRLAR